MSLGWDERDEFAEGILDCLLVGKDIGVVELHRSQNHDLRAVVQKLGLLVEERGVVFVPLDHELGSCAQAPGPAEVKRHAANEKRRVPAGLGEHEGHQRGRSRLAMGSRHHHRATGGEKQFG